jgi:hypothetical protein
MKFRRRIKRRGTAESRLRAARLTAVAAELPEMRWMNLKGSTRKNRHTCMTAEKPLRAKSWATERDEADQKENDCVGFHLEVWGQWFRGVEMLILRIFWPSWVLISCAEDVRSQKYKGLGSSMC